MKNKMEQYKIRTIASILLLGVFLFSLVLFQIPYEKKEKAFDSSLGILYLKPEEVSSIPIIRKNYDGVIYVPETKSIYYLTQNLERDKEEIDYLLKEIGW